MDNVAGKMFLLLFTGNTQINLYSISFSRGGVKIAVFVKSEELLCFVFGENLPSENFLTKPLVLN
jgi:hypothetical protein